ncbi:MAG: hypothetical protein V1681_08405 [Candidatus Neomarinimicrobiota bacterium]
MKKKIFFKRSEKSSLINRNAKIVADFFRRYYKLIITWAVIIVAIIVGIHFKVDKGLILVIVMVFGAFSQAFTGLVAIIALVPFLGPLLAKVLTLPIFWLLNALGYFVSAVAIKRGHKKEIVNYRFMTMVFLTGFAVGFIVAKLF